MITICHCFCFTLSVDVVQSEMNDLKDDLDGDQDDDDPLEPRAVFVTQVVVDHVHDLEAVAQFLVEHLDPPGHRQVAAGRHE